MQYNYIYNASKATLNLTFIGILFEKQRAVYQISSKGERYPFLQFGRWHIAAII